MTNQKILLSFKKSATKTIFNSNISIKQPTSLNVILLYISCKENEQILSVAIFINISIFLKIINREVSTLCNGHDEKWLNLSRTEKFPPAVI